VSGVVVVGNGMAGSRFVEELLDRTGQQITVIGDEPDGAYNRVLLSNVLAGHARAEDIQMAGQSWYEQRGVTLHSGVSVTAIDPSVGRIRLSDGNSLDYDTLVLATGSEAVLPPVFSGRLPAGVVAFRTLADCAAIDRYLQSSKSAVVVGAGILGLEAARGLAGRGLAVTLVQRGSRLLERQLDAPAGQLLATKVTSLGIDVLAGASVARVLTERGRVSAVVLDNGVVLPSGLLVLCCGVRPRVELARAAGLSVNTGILVDDQLRCVDDPKIFAIGDCSEHRGRTYGLVAPAWEQAKVAAQAVAGLGPTYRGSSVVTRLKAEGIELASLGESVEEAEDDDVICFVDRARGIYQKLVVRDGRISHAILLGDTRPVGLVTQLYDRGAGLPADRAALLVSRRDAVPGAVQSPPELPEQATVCFCNGVTKGAICAAWRDGARTIDDLTATTRATTGCGSCRDVVGDFVEWLSDEQQSPYLEGDAA
jgi:assimilatory nitrate reductase electron transfer subunit